MKKILFLVTLISLMSFNFAKAQSSLIATLSHDDNVKVFYGSDALKQAHEAATSGDVITLSSGSFTATDITKAITLRGAGMAMDSLNNMNHTIITGDFKCTISDTTTNLKMEGIYHNGSFKYDKIRRAQFLKCRFKIITYNDQQTSQLRDCVFLNCRIAEMFGVPVGKESDFLGNMFNNSIIEDFGPGSGNKKSSIFDNCIIISNRSSAAYLDYLGMSTFKNCIFIHNNGASYLEPGAIAYNCIAVGTNTDIFKNTPNTTNKVVPLLSDVFLTYNSVSSIANNDNETFELTEDAKTKYLGVDGTEVGIYGGTFPYTTILETPKIKKCNVAAKSTADGKLSVDIEVAVD